MSDELKRDYQEKLGKKFGSLLRRICGSLPSNLRGSDALVF